MPKPIIKWGKDASMDHIIGYVVTDDDWRDDQITWFYETWDRNTGAYRFTNIHNVSWEVWQATT